MTPRDVRLACHLTLEKTAVYAGVSQPTVRLYEANPQAVRADKRALLAAYYQRLQTRITGTSTAPVTDPGPVAA